MRTLRFIVEDQIIKLDPNCDFSNLVPGTENYLRAEFIFSPEWNGCVKAATFHSNIGKEYPPQILTDGKSCMVPAEALVLRTFKVGVIGKKGDMKITTNRVAVSQRGG